MRVKGITTEQLQDTIREVNKKFGSEIYTPYMERKGKSIQFTLRLLSRWGCTYETKHKRRGNDIFRHWTNDNWGKTKAGIHYTSAVCFHGHWEIYREIFRLNPDAVIVTALARYENLRDLENKAPHIGYRNIGSMMYPLHLENACDCR